MRLVGYRRENSARTRNGIIRNYKFLKKFTEILPWSAIQLSLLGKIFYTISSFLILIFHYLLDFRGEHRYINVGCLIGNGILTCTFGIGGKDKYISRDQAEDKQQARYACERVAAKTVCRRDLR